MAGFRTQPPRRAASGVPVGYCLAVVTVLLAATLTACSSPATIATTAEDVGESATVPPGSQEQAREPVTFAQGAPVTENHADAPLPFVQAADPEWVERTAEATYIPARVLQAYAAAAIVSGREDPECGAGWNLLAGIGLVESVHGLLRGGTIDETGLLTPAIFGVPLDGNGVAAIPDSDAGALDGDASVDRAVGPMQFIPGTWRRWEVDANADGAADPQNIDDAALAAVHYLCRAGGDLRTPEGWRAAILAWNRSEEYLGDVSGWAEQYATLAAADR